MSFHQDLNNLTRDLHDATWEVEYMKKNPVIALMLERKDLRFSGGKRYYKEVDTDTHEDLVQDYNVNENLTHGVVDSTEQVFFRKKKFQCPVQIDVDEELENKNQTPDGSQLHSLAEFRVRKANEACRVHMRKLLYRRTNHSLAASDTNKYMQGLDSALTVDATYGTITRTYSAGTKADTGFWWQPMGGIESSNSGAQTIGISWLRTNLEPLDDLETDDTDLITIIGGVLWLSLQAEAEAKNMPYKLIDMRVAKQGFKEMVLDERRVIKDPFLKAGFNTTMGETTGSAGALERRVYCLNLKDWDMYIHPSRNFKMGEFFDQSKIAGGADFTLARIKFAGNLVCWHPNRQLYFNHVAP